MKFIEEYEVLWKIVCDFVEKEINLYCDEWEEVGEFFIYDVFKKLGKLGIFGI